LLSDEEASRLSAPRIEIAIHDKRVLDADVPF